MWVRALAIVPNLDQQFEVVTQSLTLQLRDDRLCRGVLTEVAQCNERLRTAWWHVERGCTAMTKWPAGRARGGISGTWATSSRPGGGTLRRCLRVRFERKCLKPGDNRWFFVAGHGRRERDRDYLMPIDADPGNVEETAIPVGYVTERLRRCGAENVLLLLDACRNEGARDGQGVGAERQTGVVTLSSCSPNERSYEIAELQHGAFTYSLLEGLRLQGASNCATVERLDQHLRFRVPELCAAYRKPRQTPYTHAEPIEKRHLILLPRLASLSDLHPIKLDALQAEANGDFETAEQLWWRVIAVSPVDSQAHDAVKRLVLKRSAARPAATARRYRRHRDAAAAPGGPGCDRRNRQAETGGAREGRESLGRPPCGQRGPRTPDPVTAAGCIWGDRPASKDSRNTASDRCLAVQLAAAFLMQPAQDDWAGHQPIG